MTDLNWPRAAEWLRQGGLQPGLRVLGAPLRLGSITPGRCDLAPDAIRAALTRFSTHDFNSGLDLRDLPVRDLGNLALADLTPEEAFSPLRDAVRSGLSGARALVLLGGDNSLTRPGCHGASRRLERCGLLTLDAHLDLRDTTAGLSNGNPVRALLADGLPGAQIVQVGIQSFANSPAYAQVAREAGIRVVPVEEVQARGIETVVKEALDRLSERADAIYVDLDIDVLDRAFAPATPGARPGGLAPWQVRLAARLCGLHPLVRVLDLVEIDPEKDSNDVTSQAAAAALLSFAAGVLERGSRA